MSSVVDSRPSSSHVASVYSDSDVVPEYFVQQHDQVIQRLFAAGLRIQGLRRHLSDREALERIGLVTADLDATIKELRDTIYSLRLVPQVAPTFSAGIVALVATTAQGHALQPELHLSGPLDAAVPPGVAEHARGVLREGLSNALCHAAADSIVITLRVLRDRLEMRISDDGSGFADLPSCPGLTAMRRHAELCGGTLSISSTPDRGTHVLLMVALNARGS
ncbi:signal transduction histidine kinase [Arthrobacter sp. CAN_A2]|uniref:sensor histidine kinase n=1 Tax=Arthrobacter sp. CAN_A2 TaxID=2787718 RepID=UPI0018F02F99